MSETDPVSRAAWIADIIVQAKRDLAEAEERGTVDGERQARILRAHIARLETELADERRRAGGRVLTLDGPISARQRAEMLEQDPAAALHVRRTNEPDR